MAYETTFKDGSVITHYLAAAYAEGFCEGEGVSTEDQFRAWSYLCGTRIGFSLQGWFGRTINELIAQSILSLDGTLDWDAIDDLDDLDEEDEEDEQTSIS